MRLLIVKTSSLGDILQAFPVVQLIRKNLPDATIDWIVEQPFSQLVESNPAIDKVYYVQTKKWRRAPFAQETRKEIAAFKEQMRGNPYDIVFDLQGNIKSGLILAAVQAPIKVGFGFSSVAEKPNLLFTNARYNPPSGRNIREDYLFLVQRHFGWPVEPFAAETSLKTTDLPNLVLPGGQRIMVCPGSAWKNKKLPVGLLVIFLKQLVGDNTHFYCIWGNELERQESLKVCSYFPAQSTLCEKMELPALQALMRHMDLVVSMDSLPLHLAAAAGVATHSFFGPSSAQKYAPVGEQHTHFQGVCPYGKTFTRRCPALRTCKTGACLVRSVQ